LDISK